MKSSPNEQKIERIKRFKNHSLTKELQRQSRTIWFLLIALQLFIFIAAFSFKTGNFLLLFISFLITFGFYVLFKDELSEGHRKYGTTCFKITCV